MDSIFFTPLHCLCPLSLFWWREPCRSVSGWVFLSMGLGLSRAPLRAFGSFGEGKIIAQNLGTKIRLIEHIYFVVFCTGCVRWGGWVWGGGIKPYSQPDHKKIFFLDDFPIKCFESRKICPEFSPAQISGEDRNNVWCLGKARREKSVCRSSYLTTFTWMEETLLAPNVLFEYRWPLITIPFPSIPTYSIEDDHSDYILTVFWLHSAMES